MKKTAYIAVALFIAAPVLSSCRDERTVEVERLEEDVPDSHDNQNADGYDTNPTEDDPD
ncbi:MAG: hypothetical protein WBG46_15260 [Nonlabens sp.]